MGVYCACNYRILIFQNIREQSLARLSASATLDQEGKQPKLGRRQIESPALRAGFQICSCQLEKHPQPHLARWNVIAAAALKTPIVDLLTDDVWHNGRLIIPAGTEIHGAAEVERERIAGGNRLAERPTAAKQKVYGFLMEVPCRTCDGSRACLQFLSWSSALSLSIKSGEL
jgi:hypothetical protein